MKHVIAMMMLVAALGVTGVSFAAEDAKPAKPVNATCPVGGRDINPEKTSVYKGDTVGFCCSKCKAKFDANPEKYAKDIERKFAKGSCCDKAAKKGKDCKHPCCVKAEKKDNVCTKCNKKK